MSLEPGTPIGKYVVRRKIAEGGMAEIYLAAATGPEGFEKEVVIKRIRSFLSTDSDFEQMFIAEARLAARLQHANIVQVFDFDRHGDSFYIAMEYVRGQSLWEVRKRSRALMVPMQPTLVAHIGADVARGLHYAHQYKEKGKRVGLVHRDVTPHNVLLSWEGAIKLTDFGIAKAGNKLTSPGMLKGKFAYMSPEQARGEDVDARTDVFALGIVLWEMLTGGRLFEGDSDVAVLRAVQQSAIAPPGRLNPDVPAELDQVVMRALERDADKRFQTAHELERALGSFILRAADSIDDTDLGSFLRRLYAEELADENRERTQSGVRAPADPEAAAAPAQAKREPTAVLPGSSRSKPSAPPAAPPSPDEDPFASTAVVKRDGSDAAGSRAKTMPMRAYRTPGDAAQVSAPVPDAPPAPAPVPEPVAAPAAAAPPERTLSDTAVARAKKPEEAAASVVPPAPPPTSPPVAAPVSAALSAPVPAQGPASVSPSVSAPVDAGLAAIVAPRRRMGAVIGGVLAVVAIAGVVAVVLQPGGAGEGTSTPDAGLVAVVGGEPPMSPTPPPEVAEAASADAGSGQEVVTAEEQDPPEPAVAPVEVVRDPPKPPKTRQVRGSNENARGVLAMNVTPWANVFIDGVSRGDVSGRREFPLSAGKYVVRFQHPRKTIEKVVTVRDGKRQYVEFDVFKD